jgi:hypothetical protein
MSRQDRGWGRGGGSVRIAVADRGRRRVATAARYAVVVVAALVSSALVLAGVRLLRHGDDAIAATAVAPAAPAASAAPARTASTRLTLLGPRLLVDGRRSGRVPAGAEVTVPLPELPAGTRALLLEVSLLDATGPGAVTVGSAAGQLTALRLARAGAQLTATVVVPLDADGVLRVRTEGGGRLLVNLVGAFEPATSSAGGRVIVLPATEVLRLVPATDGHDADIDPARVPAIRSAGSVAAVLLQVAADVGTHGGLVSTGPPGRAPDQTFLWSATSGTDRTRTGLLVVPVVDRRIHLHYKAGTLLRADIVGYVTDGSAAPGTAGLVVPVRPTDAPPVTIAAGTGQDITVIPAGVEAVPVDRVAAAVLGVTVDADAVGAVTVRAPGASPPAQPALVCGSGPARSASVVAQTGDGAVRVDSQSAASVRLTVQALILAG